ncbi:hypothetical protein GS910_43165 [Paraburkholderia sp. RL16-012-BIC-B]|nr:hypothetical protein [Paraburkholderia madseniana]
MLLHLSTLGKIHDRMLDIGLREFALFLLARRTALALRWSAKMSPGRCLANPAVIALGLNRLRDLKHMAQSLVLNDRALIDFGQPN